MFIVEIALTLAMQSAAQPPAGGRVSGVVIEEPTNTPVAGARVVLGSPDDAPSPSRQAPEATTDADGRFTFERVPPGLYHVAALKDGFALPLDVSTMVVVNIAAGEDLGGVVVSMRRGGVITGTVLDPSGRPVDHASVSALLKRLDVYGGATRGSAPPRVKIDGPPMTVPLGFAGTEPHGVFRIDGLPSGDYLLAASPREDAAGARPTVGTTYYPGTPDESIAETLHVEVGETLANITIRMTAVRTFQVSGLVVDGRDNPVANAFVTLMPDVRGDASLVTFFTETHRSVQSDATGAFIIAGVPAGTYVVECGDSGGGIGATSRSFVIDDRGTPLVGNDPVDSPLPAGAVAITIVDRDVEHVKLVVGKQ
jgi:Carboxypeptidase regulatory-like domain